MTLPPFWRLKGFGDRLDVWAQDQDPSDELRQHVVRWIFTRFDDPYRGVTRHEFATNLWWGRTTYGELATQLDRHRLALPNLGSLPRICVAGACSTGNAWLRRHERRSGNGGPRDRAGRGRRTAGNAVPRRRTIRRFGDRARRARHRHVSDARPGAGLRHAPGPVQRAARRHVRRTLRRDHIERLQRQPVHRLARTCAHPGLAQTPGRMLGLVRALDG